MLYLCAVLFQCLFYTFFASSNDFYSHAPFPINETSKMLSKALKPWEESWNLTSFHETPLLRGTKERNLENHLTCKVEEVTP